MAKDTVEVDEAQTLGVTKSKINMGGFKDKKPEKIAKETARHEKLSEKRVELRIEKAKAAAKLKPIEKRKAVLQARLKAKRSGTRARTYDDKIVKAWIEELNLITKSPKDWDRLTNKGTLPFNPSNKKKRTTKEILDGMNLDD